MSPFSASFFSLPYLNFAEAAESTLQKPVEVLTAKSLRNPFLKKRIEAEAVGIHAS